MSLFDILISINSLQKEPQKRPRANELLTHPFIVRYNDGDADLIFWLKEYLDIQR